MRGPGSCWVDTICQFSGSWDGSGDSPADWFGRVSKLSGLCLPYQQGDIPGTDRLKDRKYEFWTSRPPCKFKFKLIFNFYSSTFIYFQLNCRTVPVQKSPKRPCNRIMSSVSKNIRQISAHRSKGDLNTGTTQNSDPEHLVLIKTQDILSPGGCCQDSPTILQIVQNSA